MRNTITVDVSGLNPRDRADLAHAITKTAAQQTVRPPIAVVLGRIARALTEGKASR